MIIVGIDPGTLISGFGVVQFQKNLLERKDSGVIDLRSCSTLTQKLQRLYDSVVDIIQLYKPEEMAIEDIFFSRNVKSALKLGHARGVVMLGALHRDIRISEYSAKEMKMAVVGNGNADKDQVRFMVKHLLRIDKALTLDESDALGLAICHAHRLKSLTKPVKTSWSAFIEAHPERVKHPRRRG